MSLQKREIVTRSLLYGKEQSAFYGYAIGIIIVKALLLVDFQKGVKVRMLDRDKHLSAFAAIFGQEDFYRCGGLVKVVQRLPFHVQVLFNDYK